MSSYSLRVEIDSRPLRDPRLKRFALIFSSKDGAEIEVRGFLLRDGAKQVRAPSVVLDRALYDVAQLNDSAQSEILHEFQRQDLFPPKPRGFGFKELQDGRR